MKSFENHIEVIAAVVRAFPEIGKTGIMKCMYFLQEVYHIDMGYRFSMYTYGPFDSDVLGELNAAIDDEYITAETYHYPNGTGYKFTPTSKNSEAIIDEKCSNSIEVLKTSFGDYDAKRWELAATVVYLSKQNVDGVETLIEWVRKLKPHFDNSKIREEYSRLFKLGMVENQTAA
jgi:hypothetical protein